MSPRLYDVIAKGQSVAWGVVLVGGWVLGANALDLFRVNLMMGLLWCFLRERAKTARLGCELKIARNSLESGSADVCNKVPSKRGRLSWDIFVGIAGAAITVLLGTARYSHDWHSINEPRTQVMVAASHIDAGVPLTITNLAHANVRDSVLVKSGYVRIRDGYVLRGHKLNAPLEYGQLIEWENTDIVIGKLPFGDGDE